ncbi:manganese transport protein [Chitinophaga costaii]|uniref:Divalent metal cation transporter MntH n=1 Tax=Chitinophaga costaii TaxID=1335309 RepID=A0A1C4DAK0_9BACT|nr:Nramp family divalent metal transporter [Chitinophaga costaii]PUZ24536.1 iron/manganese transporter [Chitinophaga costaii]SCC28415.1 manganese transport protein [Chitinophaga costaii]
MSELHPATSLGDVHESVDTTLKSKWRKILAFFGPAYLVSVGYMDPGNWATDLAGGSQYGYTLIWVLLMSNLMALLLQSHAARLGIVGGRDLAQANRDTYPKTVNFILYIFAEIAIAATDMAEVLGMAIGLQLLFGLPLIWGVSLTVLDTLLLLVLQRFGMRKMEAFIIALVAVIGVSFLWQLVMARPRLGEVILGFVPGLPDANALYIAIGIIGATVMPHNLYLHSALVQTRKIKRNEEGIRQSLCLNVWDSTIALNLAFLVNAAILILAATVFFKSGHHEVAAIQDAYKLLSPKLGTLAPILFAVALIAAGQSSTVTGTLAGQIVMEGYLHLRINPWLRRMLTRMLAILPALITLWLFGDEEINSLLVFSQVLLSFQLGFAVIPLIHFVSDKKSMGVFAIKPRTVVVSWLVALVLVYLNLRMVGSAAWNYVQKPGNTFIDILIVLATIGIVTLLFITLLYPLLQRRREQKITSIHQEQKPWGELQAPDYHCIGIALDFSQHDEKVIASALRNGNSSTQYILIHVVESAPAGWLGRESDDFETRKDREQLENYAAVLTHRGLQARAVLGYRQRAKEIARIVSEEKIDFLILGGHGHKGLKDWIFGETANQVRHAVKIPVLVVQ